jgi:spermidine synthase
LFGRYIDRRENPLKVYIYLELGIGVFGMLVPLLISCSTPLYAFIFRQFNPSFYQISLIRLVISFMILIVPCTLMGGTLPVISRFISGAFKGTTPEKQAGRLYAANTLGAVLGCLFSGYILIGTVGLAGTTAIAVFFNLTIAAALFIYNRRSGGMPAAAEKTDAAPVEKAPLTEFQVKTVIMLYALSGFLSLFLEVAWTRALVWVMGMDAYAFASMLAVFLSGLAIGSFIVSRFVRNLNGAIMKLAIIELLIGISVFISIAAIENMYGLMHGLEKTLTISTFRGAFVFFISIAAAIMALPTLLMGMAFPLALKIGLDGRRSVGAGVGTVYAANTIGSVFGALAAGFAVLPLAGVMKSVIIAGGVFIIVAAVLFMTVWEYRKAVVNAAALALCAGSAVLMLAWAPDFRKTLVKGFGGDEILLYFKETITGDVEVTESVQEGKSLKIDGVHVASDGQTDVASHKYPAHLMLFLKEHPENALLVAFGAGGTSGSILRYDEVKRLDAVEICSGVVTPARRYFTAMNNGVLDDPRLNLIIQDGKNFVRLTDRTYDIIYSGPIHPQSNQGSAALYTKDYFEDCRKRLNPGGIICIWLPLHVPPEDYKTIVRTFQEVYPHSSLWLTTTTPNTLIHTHLIGSTGPLVIDARLVSERLRKGAVAADRLDYVALAGVFDLLGQCAMGEKKLREYTSDAAQINTDNLPIAEFPRKIGRRSYEREEQPALILADMLRYKENGLAFVVNLPDSERTAMEKKLADYCKGDSLRIEGHIRYMRAFTLMKAKRSKDYLREAYGFYSDAYRCYAAAQQYLPDDRFLKEFFVEAARTFNPGQ